VSILDILVSQCLGFSIGVDNAMLHMILSEQQWLVKEETRRIGEGNDCL
jgi:hypothetical protein